MIEPKPIRAVPAWVSVLLIVGCLGGGGAFAWWFARDGMGDRIIVLSRAPGDGVKELRGGGGYRINAGDAGVEVRTKKGASPTFTFFFDKFYFYSEDEIKTLSLAKRIVDDQRVANDLGVGPQQLEQIKEIRRQAKIVMSADDEQRVATLWPAYERATLPDDKRKAEDSLVRAVEGITERIVGPAKQSVVDRTARVRAILTPEQFAKFDEMGR